MKNWKPIKTDKFRMVGISKVGKSKFKLVLLRAILSLPWVVALLRVVSLFGLLKTTNLC